jgi:4-amino-4-deoxy-L-arabinose transferase-like glycosyltransferase
VLMSGARPPANLPEEPWLPFDPQGFMAYRLAMMTFASTAFLSLWDLVRRIGGTKAARLALLLAVTTPFLVHEVWFTWPKLLGASFVLLAGICVVERKAFRSGLLVGIGYLMHPGALLSLAGIGLLALWPLRGANWRRPQVKAAVLLALGVAISLVAWRLLNGSHYSQSGFTEYLLTAGVEAHPSPLHWLVYRAASLGNTFVPMLLPLSSAGSVWINSIEGPSPPAIHFFFQYWDGLPFGAGIVFFPLLLLSLWRAWRLWRWPVFAVVITPLAAFTVYWGASHTGMLREGLQAWVLVLFAVVALQQQQQAGFPWLRSKVVRAILSLRAVELLVVALGPALATNHVLIGSRFPVSDVLTLLAMLFFAGCLGWLVWATTPTRLERADARDSAYASRGQ